MTEVLADTASDMDLVFSPFQLGNVTLRNRIVRSAHGNGLSAGSVTDDLLAYHLARARGGVALSFAEAGEVHWSSPGMLDLTTDDTVDGLNRMVEAVHGEGMKLFQQLMHGGPCVVPHDGSAPWAASAITDPGANVLPRAMTTSMIQEITAGFAAAAGRVKAAGLDGVEVHGGHGYIFSSYLSPRSNVRTDDYGGPLENRMRFLAEVLAAIRAEVGPDFVLGVRLSPDGPDDQTTVADIIEVEHALADAGLIDYVNASWGSHYQRDKMIGTTREVRGYQLPVTGQITRATSLPTLVTGRILSIADAAKVLRAGDADMVSMVRALIADPELVIKSKQGRASEIRPCISCSQACAGGLNTRGRVGCVVNVGAGRELRFGDSTLKPTASPKHVLIIGGGPAGLEAARVAATVGHRVTLFEAGPRLGGQLNLARQSPSRSDIAGIVGYFERELERLGVDVQLNRKVNDATDALNVGADAIFLATGSAPRTDGFQTWRPGEPPTGFESVEVLSGWDVLAGAPITGPVLLLDEIAHYEAIDVAEFLVQAGHEVHHVSRFHVFGQQIPLSYDYAAAAHLTKLAATGRHHFHPRSLLLEMGSGQAVIAPLEDRDHVTKLDVGTFVFMSGQVPDTSLADALEGTPNLVVIGDAQGPRTLEAAITDGALAPAQLEPGWTRRKWVRYQAGSSV